MFFKDIELRMKEVAALFWTKIVLTISEKVEDHKIQTNVIRS